MEFKYSVLTPMVCHITPKLERRSEMVGLGTSVIFVAGLQLLVVGLVASWCGIICVKLSYFSGGGRLLWSSSIRF